MNSRLDVPQRGFGSFGVEQNTLPSSAWVMQMFVEFYIFVIAELSAPQTINFLHSKSSTFCTPNH